MALRATKCKKDAHGSGAGALARGPAPSPVHRPQAGRGPRLQRSGCGRGNNYSYRNALTGSTRIALIAGASPANNPTTAIRNAAPASAHGSCARMP